MSKYRGSELENFRIKEASLEESETIYSLKDLEKIIKQFVDVVDDAPISVRAFFNIVINELHQIKFRNMIREKNIFVKCEEEREYLQISFKLDHTTEKMLDELTVYASNGKQSLVSRSKTIRALIRFGFANKNDLTFEE